MSAAGEEGDRLAVVAHFSEVQERMDLLSQRLGDLLSRAREVGGPLPDSMLAEFRCLTESLDETVGEGRAVVDRMVELGLVSADSLMEIARAVEADQGEEVLA